MCLGPGLSEEEGHLFIKSVSKEKRAFGGDVNILAALRNERAKGFQGSTHFTTARPAPSEYRPCRDAPGKEEKGRKEEKKPEAFAKKRQVWCLECRSCRTASSSTAAAPALQPALPNLKHNNHPKKTPTTTAKKEERETKKRKGLKKKKD